MTYRDNQALFCRALHHATLHEARRVGDPIAPVIVPASGYFLPGDPAGTYQYARWNNPTWSALEEVVGVLENAESVIFPSGMAAIASVLYTQLKPGDKLLLPSDGYITTRTFADTYLAPAGIAVSTCPTVEYEAQDFAGYRLVWIETPSNPTLDICDLRKTAAKAKQAGALVVADNTTLTPLGQRPLDLGTEVVVSSDTKAVNGHSDVVFGHVASRQGALIAAIREWRKLAGAIPGVFESWLVHRGLESLEVRFDRMCSTAETIAPRLAEQAKIQHVRFPGLPAHPAHATACSQMARFGSLIGVTFASKDHAERFIEECSFIRSTTSFGGVHTSAERRARWGDKVPEGYVRLSVGCEPAEALWNGMRTALDKV
jgi:cystathionine gamma-lyase